MSPVKKTAAAATLRFVEANVRDVRGEPMTCECGAPLSAYRIDDERGRKVVLCCETARCGNRVTATAKMFRAELLADDTEGNAESEGG